MSQDYSQINVQLSLQALDYLKQISAAQEKTKKFASEAAASFGTMKSAIVASGYIATLDHILKKTDEARESQERLNTTYLSTRGVAGVSTNAINQYADSLEKTSTYSKVALLEMGNELLRYTNIHKNEFQGAMEASANLAAGLRISLAEAANIAGKALQNPANASRALRAAHITLSEAQDKAVKSMQAMGDMAGAQRIILEKFAEIYGDQATLRLNSYSGQLEKASQNITKIAASIGDKLEGPIVRLMKDFNNIASNSHVIEGISTAIEAGLTPLRLMAQELHEVISSIEWAWEWAHNKLTQNSLAEAMKGAQRALLQKPGAEGEYQIPGVKGSERAQAMEQGAAAYHAEAMAPRGPEEQTQKKLDEDEKKYQQYFEWFKDNEQMQSQLYEDHQAQIDKITEEGMQKQIDAGMKAGNQLKDSIENVGHGIESFLQQNTALALQHLQRMNIEGGALIDAWAQGQKEAAGVADEAQSTQHARELENLQKQYSRTSSITEKKNLQEQMTAKQHEIKKAKIDEDAAKAHHMLEMVQLMQKNAIAKKNFENAKAFQYATATMNMGSAIAAAVADAFMPQSSGGFVYLGIAMAAAASALIAGIDAVQIAQIERQQYVPQYSAGAWNIPSEQLALLHPNEMVVPAQIAEPVRQAVQGGDGGKPTVYLDMRGSHNYDSTGTMRVIKDVFSKNNISLLTKGAY